MKKRIRCVLVVALQPDKAACLYARPFQGLQRIYSLTRSGGYELRIDLADFDNATAFARYAHFSVGRDSVNPEEDGYPLLVDGYSGTAGTDWWWWWCWFSVL